MREATQDEKNMSSVLMDDETAKAIKNSTVVEDKGNRAARRNALRVKKGLSKQLRNRDHPKYRPVQNAGGGMRRNHERAAEASKTDNV